LLFRISDFRFRICFYHFLPLLVLSPTNEDAFQAASTILVGDNTNKGGNEDAFQAASTILVGDNTNKGGA
jgi:hypothetical protein